MPIIKSAKKALRQSKKRQTANLVYKTKIKKTKKTIEKKILAKELDLAKQDLSKYYKIVDKATKRNILHKNKASRLKSRLAKKTKA